MAMKISLLSTLNNPLLGHILQHILRKGVLVDSIILDSMLLSESYLEVWNQRTGKIWQPISIYEFESCQIPVYFVRNHSSKTCRDLVRSKELDLLVNAGSPRILKPTILEAPRYGVLNCHPGLLPDYRGCSSVEWAIYHNAQVGNTVHFMTESVDDGPIVAQESLLFSMDDSYQDIRRKVYFHGFELLASTVCRLVQEGVERTAFKRPTRGAYFRPMDKETLAEVEAKVSRGHYAYQRSQGIGKR